jgi:hypothetical protein
LKQKEFLRVIWHFDYEAAARSASLLEGLWLGTVPKEYVVSAEEVVSVIEGRKSC